MKEDEIYIYGRNPVMEALQHKPECVAEVFMAEGSKDAHLGSMLEALKIQRSILNTRILPGGLPKEVVHQGVVARLSKKKLLLPYKEFVKELEVVPNTALLIFGEVQDPQNVGAAIRSAAAFGLSGVLVPPHNQAPINGTVIKVSAGTAFQIPLVEIKNVNTTLRDLKKRGFWTYGLDERGDVSLPDEDFKRPAAFVLGNEGSGLRKETAKTCDTLLKIPMKEGTESLNAAASVATVLYEWAKQHPSALK